MRESNTIKSGAHASLESFWRLFRCERLFFLVLIPHIALLPLYQYHYTTQGFHYFPLCQVPFLLFKYIADIQTALQESGTEYTFFSLSQLAHYLWAPIILFVAYYLQMLAICYIDQIHLHKADASLEQAFINAAPRAYIACIWSLITCTFLLPLAMLWSFSQQETLLREFIFADSPFTAWLLTNTFFRFCLLIALFFHQWITYGLLAIFALDKTSFGNALLQGWHYLQHNGSYVLGATLGFSVLWGLASWACKPFLTSFIIPMAINSMALLFTTYTYLQAFQPSEQSTIDN